MGQEKEAQVATAARFDQPTCFDRALRIAQLLGRQRRVSHLAPGSLPLALLVDSPDQNPAHQVALE
jgi:hypothetical protein